MNAKQKTCNHGRNFATLLLLVTMASCQNDYNPETHNKVSDNGVSKNIPYGYKTNSCDLKFTDASNFMLNVIAASYKAWSSSSEKATISMDQNKRQQKIIRDGVLVLKSENIDRSRTEIDSLIRAFQVQVESENLENEMEYIQKRYELRVHHSQFDALLNALQLTHNEVINLNIQARDMTNEYVDIEMRANHERVYLETYKDLLRKATNIKDVLKIKSQIQQLEEEIESKSKQLLQIDASVFMSKLTLTVTQPFVVDEATVETTFKTKVVDSISNGWNSVVDLVLWIISQWPILLTILTGILLIKLLIRKRRRIATEV